MDKVVRESVPLEGEMEDLDRPEELWTSVNPIPTENNAQQTPTPIPESIFEEGTEGVLLPVAEDIQRTRKNANAITTPQEMQMASETTEEVEDQAMALWLSDPDEDDEDVAEDDD